MIWFGCSRVISGNRFSVDPVQAAHEFKIDGENETMNRSASQTAHREDPRLEAAQRRLRESVGQADTLEAIREIVANLLGCEEIGLFTTEQENGGPLFWSFGIDPQRHGTLDSFEGAPLQRVLQGEFHIAQIPGQGDYEGPRLRVFVPIRRQGRTVAVLVMVRLLPQKLGFDEADLDLVKLLSNESGRTLFDGSKGGAAMQTGRRR
jgi:hypothetical protein